MNLNMIYILVKLKKHRVYCLANSILYLVIILTDRQWEGALMFGSMFNFKVWACLFVQRDPKTNVTITHITRYKSVKNASPAHMPYFLHYPVNVTLSNCLGCKMYVLLFNTNLVRLCECISLFIYIFICKVIKLKTKLYTAI